MIKPIIVVNNIKPDMSEFRSLFVHPIHFKVAMVFEFRRTIIQEYNKDKNIPTPRAIKKLVLANPDKSGFVKTSSIE